MSDRRSAGTQASRAPAPNESNPLETPVVGVSDQRIKNDPDQFVGELFQGATFSSLNKPNAYPAGGTVRVSGTMRLDMPQTPITKRGMRVRISSPAFSRDYTQRFRGIQHGTTRQFSLDIPVPDAPGERFAYTVRGERTELLSLGDENWAIDTTRGPFNVQIQSEAGATITNSFTYLPYVFAGAGIGVGADALGDLPTTQLQSTLFGGAAGAIFKQFGPSLGVNVGNIIPNVSTTKLAIGTAGVFGAAYLLRSTGASEILEPVGETVGAAASVGSAAAQKGADRARARLSGPRAR
jgi:hypothetical protein